MVLAVRHLRLALLLSLTVLLSGCLTGYLEEDLQKQREQLEQQKAEMAKQRQELDALRAGQQLQNQQNRDCNRAFREYFDKAQALQDRAKAIELYQQGLAICPEDDVAHFELAQLLAAQGDKGGAEKEFEAALKINPGFDEARRQLDALRQQR